ncbi:hypothetical protein BDA99DRAFT_119578 [Phascolomyces articulosus]|uniref:Uncharacterized protein n=1 Tax=Phascolomyces articulosus TaxID=60185 RepID=A0AAD5KP75_9FUNG|nr:hypothetical protein BDA99DRAFT_119578 [Phascolomyces articulosus]
MLFLYHFLCFSRDHSMFYKIYKKDRSLFLFFIFITSNVYMSCFRLFSFLKVRGFLLLC